MIEKILVADDSALMRKSLCDIISAQDEKKSIKTVMDGASALREIRSGEYDLCIIGIFLKQVNGMEIIQKMQQEGITVPVIVLGSSLMEDKDAASVLLGISNVRYVIRPFRITPENRESFAKELTDAVQSFSRVARRPVSKNTASSPERKATDSVRSRSSVVPKLGSKRIVIIASSTGGPQALHEMIPMLPKLGVPVVIVQHMPAGFTLSLAERINQKSVLTVKEAEENEPLLPDTVYIAPGGRHLQVVEKAGTARCHVYDDSPVNNLRPCADVMFESFTKLPFDDIVCAVLTGMGHDGTEGIRILKQKKKLHVITQTADTCVVYGMPKSVDLSGFSNESVPIDKIAAAIAKELGV